jgi:hypothetical protein
MISAENRLFKDLAVSIDEVAKHSSKKLLGHILNAPSTEIESSAAWRKVSLALINADVSEGELSAVLRDPLLTQAHSFLVTLDGGTQLSDHGRIFVHDHEGRELNAGLHELFFDYLDEAGYLQPWNAGVKIE